jgi:long-chain fatty acid transport protein
MKNIAKRILVVLVASLVVVDSSFATDGYFLTGYGAKQQGRGGTGVAFPGDSLAGATNPAGLIFVGDRIDFGLTLFRPIRSGTLTGNQLPPGYPDVNGTYDASRVEDFFLPELGYSHQLRPNVAVGVALYGNGGLNTSYTKPIPLLGSTRGGVDLEQLFNSPTLAYKAGAHNSFGVAANIAYQRFSAEGLQNFANANESSDPSHVTNTGYSNSFGGGVRVGWIGELSRWLNVGATYQSRTYTSRFSRYSGLFAEGGIKIHSKATVQFDAERILYGQVKSVANSDANQAPLGAANGPGFGWHDITVIKTGLDYKLNSALTIRGGYNHAGLPFDGTQTFFNLLAPAVTQDHLHAGATWTLKSGKEINLAYIHAFESQVNGVNSVPPSAGGGNANLSMYQNSVQVSFGWKGSKR